MGDAFRVARAGCREFKRWGKYRAGGGWFQRWSQRPRGPRRFGEVGLKIAGSGEG